MGKGGGSDGSSTNTTTNVSSPPPQVLAAYQQALTQAQTASSAPLQQYQGNTVAGFTPDQTSAMGTVDNLQGVSQPYISQAQGLINQGTQPLWGSTQQFSPSAVSQYESPYTSQVYNAQVAQEGNTDAQQQSALQGNAISQGAWGGDRAGVASAVLSGQQDLANNATNANILNTGYNTGLSEFNTQQQAQLGANEANSYLDQQGAYGLGSLGNEALTTGLTGATAQLQSGQLQQTQNQENLNVPYEQFLQQQAYPFQTAQYYANIAEGLGSQEGGTSSSTSPAPSTTAQNVGLGLGVGGILGSSLQNRGGAVNGKKYNGGGFVPHRGQYAPGGEVPDLSVSYVPSTSGGGGGGRGGSTIPGTPKAYTAPDQSQQEMSNLSAFGKLAPQLKGLLGGSGTSGAGGLSMPGMDNLGNSGSIDPNTGESAATSQNNSSNFLSLLDNSGSSGAADSGSSLGSDSGSSAFNDIDWGSIFSDAASSEKQGGYIKPRHFASGGSSDSPLTFLFGSGDSATKSNNANVKHSNGWMATGGKWVGTAIGDTFGAPFGGTYWGPLAGEDAGGTLGDAFGGNFDSVGSDIKAGPAGMLMGSNNSAAGEGNSPQMGGNFSNTSYFKRGGFTTPHFDVGGQTPMTAGMSVQNPQQQASSSSYQNMTPEQLQMIMMRLPPGSQQARAAQQVLQQKRTMPNVGVQAQGGFSSQQQPTMARGGFAHYDDGGDIPYPPSPMGQEVQQDVANEDTGPAYGSGLGTPTTQAAPQTASSSEQASMRKPDPWLALANAGFGMAASNNPHWQGAAGEGALAGLKNYGEQQKQDDTANYEQGELANRNKQTEQQGQYQQGELGVRKEEAEARAKQMSAEADRWNAMLKQNQEKLEQGRYTMSPTGMLIDSKTGQMKLPMMGGSAGSGDSGDSSMNPMAPVISGFPPSDVMYNPVKLKAATQADEQDIKSSNQNEQIGNNILSTLDHMQNINDQGKDLWGSGGDARTSLAKGEAFLGIGGDDEKKKADLMNGLDKNSNDLATDWQKFEYVPGGRGSVLALKTILASKPGVSQTYNVNSDIINELRGKVYDMKLGNEVANTYRGAQNSPGVVDGNVNKVEDTLRTLYPTTTIDPQSGRTVFHPENVQAYRDAIPDAIHNPAKYFSLARQATTSDPSTQQQGSAPQQQGASQQQGPSASDVAYLKANPSMAPKFEARFGQGSANQVLGGQ